MSGANHLSANAQNGGLARRANPEMPLIQQEIDAVLFQLNGVRSVIGDALHDFNRRDLNFEPARSAFIGMDASRDDHAGLLRKSSQRLERHRLILQRYHALDRSRAVAKNREKKFA